ncbi:MAG: flagellin [Actinomycetia bacterium]|nr:flagellin [Actinomycetes bacterium]
MRINQNIMAFNASRNLNVSNSGLGKSLEKLSSGFRINRAADDASGLVISQNLRAQISGLKQAGRNAQDGISVVQTAEGALTEVHSMLNRMRDLAVQSGNTGSTDSVSRQAAQDEVDALISEIDRISNTTKFGKMNLLDGTYGTQKAEITGFDADGSVVIAGTEEFTINLAGAGAVTVALDTGATHTDGAALAAYVQSEIRGALNTAGDPNAEKVSVSSVATGAGFTLEINAELADTETMVVADTTGTFLGNLGLSGTALTGTASGSGGVFQVGANNTGDDRISFTIDAVSSAGLSVSGLDVTSAAGAQAALDAIDTAISSVSTTRGELGALQNRFESTIANLQVTTENVAASESRIRDTDIAMEMVEFTKNQILQQAGTAMLAQANLVPQSVLRLLG